MTDPDRLNQILQDQPYIQGYTFVILHDFCCFCVLSWVAHSIFVLKIRKPVAGRFLSQINDKTARFEGKRAFAALVSAFGVF